MGGDLVMLNRLKILILDLLVNTIASSKLMPHEIRYFFYKAYGISTQTKNINPDCFMGGNRISIGQNTFINYGCRLDNSGEIIIGANCDIGFEVLVCTSTHVLGESTRRAGKAIGKQIVIKNGCWIGARTTILGGVTIGEGCVIAAGSLVNKDCESNGLYAGVPAKRIKELT